MVLVVMTVFGGEGDGDGDGDGSRVLIPGHNFLSGHLVVLLQPSLRYGQIHFQQSWQSEKRRSIPNVPHAHATRLSSSDWAMIPMPGEPRHWNFPHIYLCSTVIALHTGRREPSQD